MIKYIIDTVSSLRDVNGNCYHFARITSTKTGNSLVIDSVGGESNAPSLVRSKLDLDFSEIHYTNTWESKRDWQRMSKFASSGLYEHDITATMLRRLNRKDYQS